MMSPGLIACPTLDQITEISASPKLSRLLIFHNSSAFIGRVMAAH